MSFDIRKGQKASPVGKSGLMSRNKANMCLAASGALANFTVTRGPTDDFFIHPNNAVLQIQQEATLLDLHPFKIYQFPDSLRKFGNTNDSRRFKVRDGYVYTNGDSVGFNPIPGTDQITVGGDNAYGENVLGYDLSQIPPNSSAQWVGNGTFSTWNEIVILNNATHYIFWLSFVLPVAGGSWGGISSNTWTYGVAVAPESNYASAQLMMTGETFDARTAWPTRPLADLYNIPIGEVWVNDGNSPTKPANLINQILATSLILPSHPYGSQSAAHGIVERYRGDYGAGVKYYVGDTVTITFTDASSVASQYKFIYDPPAASVYQPATIPGPLIGVSPNGNSPDPWKLLSKSPSGADYHLDASYQAAKHYLRET